MGSGGDGDPGQWWPLVQDLDRVKETRSYLAPPPPPQQLTSTQIYFIASTSTSSKGNFLLFLLQIYWFSYCKYCCFHQLIIRKGGASTITDFNFITFVRHKANGLKVWLFDSLISHISDI